MYRHLCLRNTRSLSYSLRSLLKNYLEDNKECKEKLEEILVMVLQGLTLQGLTQSDTFQIVSLLQMIFSRRRVTVNKHNYQSLCIDLMQRLFQYLNQRNKISSRSLQNMVNLYISLRMDEKAQKYLKKIAENIKLTKNLIKMQKNLQKNRVEQLKIIISSLKLVQAFYKTYEEKFDQAYQNLIKLYNQFTEYQVRDQSLKINILNNLVCMAIRLDKIQIAQSYNNLLKIQLQNYCLPRKISIQFSYYFLHEAQIVKKSKRYQQALNYLERVIQQINDPLRGPNFIKVVKQTYYQIADCYKKMGNPQKCLQFLLKNYEFSKIYEHFELEQTIQILNQIIKIMLSLRKSGQDLSFYFYQLTYMKTQFLLDTQFKIKNSPTVRLLPFFNFSKCPQIEKDYDYVIMVKKISIQFLQNYLPLFSNWYKQQNEAIFEYYYNKNSYNMACRYLWNVLKCQSNKNEKYYQNQQKFINLLKKCNSSRRAFVYLKKHAFSIPQIHQNYKVSVFRILNQLSFQLNTKDHSLYQFIWKYKAMKSLDNLMQSQQKFQEAFPNKFIRKIYEKKMKMVELQIQQKRKVVINLPQSYQQSSQQQSINRDSLVTTQDIITRKLILHKQRRRQAAIAH